MTKPETKRSTLYFPPEAGEHLRSIFAKNPFETTVPGIVHAALEVYMEALDIGRLGYRIRVRELDGQEQYFSLHTRSSFSKTHGSIECAGVDVPRNFAATPETLDKIGAVKARSRFLSNADVIRAVLRVYDELTQVEYNHGTIVIIDLNGREQIYSPYVPLEKRFLEKDYEGWRAAFPQRAYHRHDNVPPAPIPS